MQNIHNNNTTHSIVKLVLLTAFALLLSACGGGSDSGSGSTSAGEVAAFSALTVGASCGLTSNGTPVVGATKLITGNKGTADLGDIKVPVGTLVLTCSGGTYTDESTGVTITGSTHRAVTNYTGGVLSIVASPLSEIAARLIEAANGGTLAGTISNTIIANANIGVADNFSLDGIDFISTMPTDINVTSANNNTDADKVALIMAGISQLATGGDKTKATNNGTQASDDIITTLFNQIGTIGGALTKPTIVTDAITALAGSTNIDSAASNISASSDTLASVTKNTGLATPTSTADTVAPVITLTGANTVTIAQGSTFTDAGATVIDNVDTGLTATVTGVVTPATVGSYTLTYNVSDAAGNAAVTVARTVTVTDQTAPAITLTGANAITIAQGSSFTDSGSSVSDNVDIGLTAAVTGTVNTATVGAYTLTYNASDAAGNVATTVTRTVNVVVFPAVSIVAASVLEGDSGATNLVFTVSLAAASTVDVSVDYTTADVTAFSGDYTPTTATLTITAGASSGNITVIVNGDTVYEGNETLSLTLSNPVNATLATATATGTIFNDDVGGLNDTGMTKWGNASVNNLTVTQSTFPDQDADHGRDAQFAAGALAKTGAGKSSFDFTKLNNLGIPISNQAAVYSTQSWDCVRDNATGLIWEVKTSTASSLRNKNNVYTWFNSTGANNGGNVGTASSSPACTAGGSCDTEKYVAAINARTGLSSVCGFTDWRLPNIEELRSILDYSIPFPGPSIDTAYFPNSGSFYWSATPYLANATQTWGVSFSGSQGIVDLKSASHFVRLVRGGQ